MSRFQRDEGTWALPVPRPLPMLQNYSAPSISIPTCDSIFFDKEALIGK